MLAAMLRCIIAVQMAIGAALGYGLGYWLTGTAPWQTVLLCAIAMPFIGSVLTTAYGCVRSRGDEPAALWWRSLMGECLTNIRVFVLRQPWTGKRPALQSGLGSEARIPVLLVHGYCCNHRVWDELALALRKKGHSVLAVDLEPLFCSIDDYAPQLEQAVQTLMQRSGQSKLALVGHSMGGVVIRSWMRRYGTERVARVITLGTPHVGTQIKASFKPTNVAQMAWQSPWLQELAATENQATRNLMRIALSPQDNIVYPQRTQILDGVHAHVFEGMGHLQLCIAVKVRLWLCGELSLL
jgi:triacylglycerol lipase